MGKLFAAVALVATLSSGQALAGCARNEDQLASDKGTVQRAVLASAMSCGDVALTSHAVFYRVGEPQQADAAFLAFVLLLQSQKTDQQHKTTPQ